MALDKIVIGARVRKIREEFFEESRDKFSKRCNCTKLLSQWSFKLV